MWMFSLQPLRMQQYKALFISHRRQKQNPLDLKTGNDPD